MSALGKQAFLDRFGEIYELSAWVAETAYAALPPGERADLGLVAAAMRAVVEAADEAQQLALLRAHPDLAGRLARAGGLSEASSNEQAGAGLNLCTDEEFEAFQELNAAYREKFGFPFIIAVKGLTRADILNAFRARLRNDRATEFRAALDQVHRIAGFRLESLAQEEGAA